jgi:hypothetical protein
MSTRRWGAAAGCGSRTSIRAAAPIPPTVATGGCCRTSISRARQWQSHMPWPPTWTATAPTSSCCSETARRGCASTTCSTASGIPCPTSPACCRTTRLWPLPPRAGSRPATPIRSWSRSGRSRRSRSRRTRATTSGTITSCAPGTSARRRARRSICCRSRAPARARPPRSAPIPGSSRRMAAATKLGSSTTRHCSMHAAPRPSRRSRRTRARLRRSPPSSGRPSTTCRSRSRCNCSARGTSWRPSTGSGSPTTTRPSPRSGRRSSGSPRRNHSPTAASTRPCSPGCMTLSTCMQSRQPARAPSRAPRPS